MGQTEEALEDKIIPWLKKIDLVNNMTRQLMDHSLQRRIATRN